MKEMTRLGVALRSLGGFAGGSVGALLGNSSVGSSLGTSLGASISKWLGSGEYRISSNSLVLGPSAGNIPMMHSTSTGVTIRHREFLRSISGTTAFDTSNYFVIQPCDANTFPWLSGIAERFQQYRFKGLVFHYVPTSGTSSTSQALGSVMIQTSYRSNDSVPQSKAEMLNEYYANESVPYAAFCHPIECSPKENPFMIHYTRNVPIPASDTPLMYDIGKTFVATSGNSPAVALGDIWVSYEIELMKPLVASNTILNVANQYGVSFTTSSTSAPFLGTGANTLGSAGSNAQVWMSYAPNGFFFSNAGVYNIVVRFYSSGGFTAFSSPAAPTYVNAVAGYSTPSNAAPVITNLVSNTNGNNSVVYLSTINASTPGASVTFATWSWTGTATTIEFLVTQVQ